MAAILHSKRSDAPTDTSTLIEASTGVLDRRQGIGRLFGRVDPEDLREAPPAQRRDDYGADKSARDRARACEPTLLAQRHVVSQSLN